MSLIVRPTLIFQHFLEDKKLLINLTLLENLS